jgi:hypothetical protein
LGFNSYAQNNTHGHSEDIEIKEKIFVKIRPISQSSKEYYWLEDYFLDNYKHYVELVESKVGSPIDFSSTTFVSTIEEIKAQIISDFKTNGSGYVSQKEADKAKNSSNNDGFTPKAAGQPCNNADFETGNATGWELFAGTVTNQPYGYTGMAPIALGTQHKINSSGTDPNVPTLPKVYPGGGQYSMQLGDYGTGGKAASMKQTFLVDANSASFTYSYAIVLEDPSGHSLGEKPFFKVNMYDQNNQPINCADYHVIAGAGGDPGFIGYGGTGSIFSPYSGYYLPWRTTFIPLGAYVGQNVTIEFVTGDCSQSGHFGYAYIDAACSPLNVTKSSDFICAGQPVTLTAPPGASGYLWTPNGETTQTITTTTPGDYTVKVTPVTGGACSATLPIHVDGSLDHPVADFTVQPASICIGDSVKITDASYVQGTSSITGWDWDLNGDGTIDTTAQNPGYVTYPTAGTYNVKLKIYNNGCDASKTLTVNVNQGPDAFWTPPAPMCSSASPVDLNSYVTGTAGGTWSGNGVTGSMFNPSGGTQTITYNVSDATCNRSETHVITVIPNPVITFTTPDEICLKGQPITLTATPAGGTFKMNNQVVTTFDPQAQGLGDYYITYTAADPNYPQCFATVTDTITVKDGFPVTATVPDFFCYGDSNYVISMTPTGGFFNGSLIPDSVTNILTISTAQPGNYTFGYTYTSPEGCTGTFSHSFTVGQKIKVEATLEQSCWQNVTLTAVPKVGNFVNYEWKDQNGNVLGTNKTFSGHIPQFGYQDFYLNVVDNKGCKTGTSLNDSVIESFGPNMFQIPNVITANGDNINDCLDMPVMDNPCIEYSVLILNRWGNVVYECTKDTPTFCGKDKSGTKLSDGVYFYKVVSKDIDCSKEPFKPLCYGFITVISK